MWIARNGAFQASNVARKKAHDWQEALLPIGMRHAVPKCITPPQRLHLVRSDMRVNDAESWPRGACRWWLYFSVCCKEIKAGLKYQLRCRGHPWLWVSHTHIHTLTQRVYCVSLQLCCLVWFLPRHSFNTHAPVVSPSPFFPKYFHTLAAVCLLRFVCAFACPAFPFCYLHFAAHTHTRAPARAHSCIDVTIASMLHAAHPSSIVLHCPALDKKSKKQKQQPAGNNRTIANPHGAWKEGRKAGCVGVG